MCPKPLVIDDYPYFPKSRPSFRKGPIKDIIDVAYNVHKDEYRQIIMDLYRHTEFYRNITTKKTDELSPYLKNGYMPLLDGIMIYNLLARANPAYYFEIGAGNSTKYAARAIANLGLKTKIISVDPSPRAEIDQLCDAIYRYSLEDFNLELLRILSPDDILVVDSSHRAFPNSDVTIFFTEALPILPSGVIYGLHDVILPDEAWCERLYNEQYMLSAYLIGGGNGDSIYFPTAYLQHYTDLFKNISVTISGNEQISLADGGCFFWMRRK